MRTIIKVGRNVGNDIVINDPNVSGFHCQLRMDESGNCYVQDLNSTNGTFVNGVRHSNEISLNQSDIVRIGNTTLPWQTYINKPIDGVNGQGRNVINNGIKPNNFLVWAILTTVFCLLQLGFVLFVDAFVNAPKVDGLFVFFMILGIVFGIVSIVNASKVDGLWRANDQIGATDAASKAKTWFWWSLGVGLGFWLFWLIYSLAKGSVIFG